jgi:hypothetical protein
MVILIVMFLIVAVPCTLIGAGLIGAGTRKANPPAIPPARAVNTEGVEQARVEAAPRGESAGSVVGRGLAVTFGIGLIAAPWALGLWLLELTRGGLTKGRVLRIRNRAQLPEPARGDGWAGDAVALECTLTADERRVVGELWLLTARMEHASVAAFSQLGLHLAALGAPSRLLQATHRAALDEIRHARACFAIVRAVTGESHTAGPIRALATTRAATIDLTRLAVGSLVDGCLGEGLAADVAAHGARCAEDRTIREVLAMIARDEAGHAELAWDVLAWCLAEGGAALALAVEARVAVLGRELTPQLPDLTGFDAAALARHGIIDQRTLGDLAGARIAAVQDRARRMLADRAPAVANAA